MAGRNDFLPGESPDWRIYDHGDPRTDEWWRELFRRRDSALNRHASLGGAIPSEDADYCPPEYVNAGQIPDSYFICQDILNATDDAGLLS